MKSETIPLPRTITRGTVGSDAEAVKRALVKWNHGKKDGAVIDKHFGEAAQLLVKRFQTAEQVTADGAYGPTTHAKLIPFFDEYGASLMAREAVALAKSSGRALVVEEYRWMIQHRAEFEYAQVRPIPIALKPHALTRIATDCSGSVTLAARWAGVPDPNGLNYNGQGNTGTMLAHCTEITAAQAQPGDLVWYGSSNFDRYGHHVVLVLSRKGSDLECGSHGHPGTPASILQSAEQAAQRTLGYPYVRYLRWLPT